MKLGRYLRNVGSEVYSLLLYPTSFILLAHVDFPLVAMPNLYNIILE
jgi:hypothetical protein